MRTFRYEAAAADGSLRGGEIAAASDEAARSQLADRGLFPVRLGVSREPASVGAPRAADVRLLLRQLAGLLDAGLPVARALRTLESLVAPRSAALVGRLRARTADGMSLAAALAAESTPLPPAVLALVAAGEGAGDLAGGVGDAAQVVEDAAALRASLREALAYPTVLAITGVGSVGFMVAVVIPRFASLLGDLGQRLPRSTQLLLDLAAAAREHGVVAAIAGALLAASLAGWGATAAGRLAIHRLLLSVPLVGPLRHARATSLALRALAALTGRGVPVVRAFELAGAAAGDAEIASRFAAARDRIRTGARIAAALRETGAVTPTALQLVAVGEESGRVADFADRAAWLEQQSLDRELRRALKLLEPAMILLFAGVVAFVATALLQSIYAVRVR